MKQLLTKVDQFMTANGETVRYQPVDTLPRVELENQITRLHSSVDNLLRALQTHPRDVPHSYKETEVKYDKVSTLQALSRTHLTLLSLYHTLGLSHVANLACFEQAESNLTKIWDDGKLHKDSMGFLLDPPTYMKPDFESIIRQAYQLPSLLFENHVPSTVTHLDEPTQPVD
jgi:hypothetical protein